MPLPTGPILGILTDNLRLRKSVLPLSKSAATRWAKNLNLPKGGETVLYTGHLYQLIPVIDTMSKQMAFFENSWITKFFGLGRFANKFVNLSFFMGLLTPADQKKAYDKMLQNIAGLLKKADVSFGYLYGEELYSGALIYDEGIDDAFKAHAKRVVEMLKRNGVKRVITVDPHTTNMLREVYPKVVPGFDCEVKSYLEVLAEKLPESDKKTNQTVVVHDSCVYARYENVIEEPRTLLAGCGVTALEPDDARKATHCCGGPIEALFPSEAHRVAENRLAQLKVEGDHIVSMCPICIVNLTKAAKGSTQISDISAILAKAHLER